jgi:8-oxo-dGTP pyrophosphatase MutT (NUDIX family)
LRPWKTIATKTVLEHSRYLKVESHTIQLPNGQTIEDWPWVIVPDAVIVLAQTARGEYLCFRQTKYAVEGTTLAPVGGMIQDLESPIQAAKRELMEETGYTSDDWVDLGSYVLEPNRGVSTANLFLARGALRTTEPQSDDLEDQQLLALNKSELEHSLAEGQFKIVTWAAVVALALLHIESDRTTR